MKTGIEHIYEVFKKTANTATEYFVRGDKTSLRVADNLINYMEGLGFAGLMAYKEKKSDYDLVNEMNTTTADYRVKHMELTTKLVIAETP